MRINGTFVPRKCHEPGGIGYLMRTGAGMPPLDLPRDAAGYRSYQTGEHEWVTWSEILQKRREWQRERLQAIESRYRVKPAVRPAQLWVFDNGDMFPFGGWWCYLRTWKPGGGVDYIGDGGPKGDVSTRGTLWRHLMQTIPMWLFPHEGNFAAWCAEIARLHPKRPRGGSDRPEGILNGWTDGRRFALHREELKAHAEA